MATEYCQATLNYTVAGNRCANVFHGYVTAAGTPTGLEHAISFATFLNNGAGHWLDLFSKCVADSVTIQNIVTRCVTLPSRNHLITSGGLYANAGIYMGEVMSANAAFPCRLEVFAGPTHCGKLFLAGTTEAQQTDGYPDDAGGVIEDLLDYMANAHSEASKTFGFAVPYGHQEIDEAHPYPGRRVIDGYNTVVDWSFGPVFWQLGRRRNPLGG